MIDHVKITARAGNGGRGITSFRREKFVPKGGPDGGDGGRGGNVIIRATGNLTTLSDLRYKKIFEAQHGQAGGAREMKGADGEDIIIYVPTGSIIQVNRIESEKIKEKRGKGDHDNKVEYQQNILNYRRMQKEKNHEIYKKTLDQDTEAEHLREKIGENNQLEEQGREEELVDQQTTQTYPQSISNNEPTTYADEEQKHDSQSHKLYKFSTNEPYSDEITQVQNTDSLIPTFDLIKEGEEIIIARGGRGGRGNTRFKSPSHQTPMESERGQKGDIVELEITLKMIAQVGLIGFPNAGKSTLLSKLTAATPKIGDYPFTTLEPNLGVLKEAEKTLVLADLPGLIEGAHQGKGLGIQFLQHIERTALLLHLIALTEPADTSAHQYAQDIYQNYNAIREELLLFKAGLEQKHELIVINKIDLLPEDQRLEYIKAIEDTFADCDKQLIFISAQEGNGLTSLKKILLTHF